MLVSKKTKICVTPHAKHKICVTPNAKPQRKPMEYRLCWVPNAKSSVGHVHFISFGVNFIRIGFRFSVEYGLKAGWMGLCFGSLGGSGFNYKCIMD